MNRITFATSIGSPIRFNMCLTAALRVHSSYEIPSRAASFFVAVVSMQPGHTEFTRTLNGAKSSAMHLVICSTAPFDEL